MELIRVWRNAQMRVLRQSRPLSPEDQKRYFRDVVMPTFEQPQPPMLLFTYLLDDHPIGYGGLVHIDWENRRAEISFLLETARSREDADGEYARLFSCFLALMKRIAFDELGLNRLYTETFDIRPLHVQVLEQNGFRPEGAHAPARAGGRPVRRFVDPRLSERGAGLCLTGLSRGNAYLSAAERE